MSDFQASRLVKTYVHCIHAPPDCVFPLLCPVREYDWIDGWSCTMLYAESGHAEHGCTFETEIPGTGWATWIVTEYDPVAHRIGFAVFVPWRFVERLEIALVEVEGGTTEVRWVRTYTGLSPEGNGAIARLANGHLDQRMEWLGRSLEHYCTTGEKLLRA